jgi:hypothetical protein
MDYELPHAHASNAAEELEALQATDFWPELPADLQVDLCRSHAILRTIVGTMEATGLA